VSRWNEPALILRRLDIAESDQLITFFTPKKGKQKGIAKGAKRSRKRFGGLLLPFILVSMNYFEQHGRGLVRIENCDLIQYYYMIYEDLQKLIYGCYFLELVETVLPEGESSENLFQFLLTTFEVLESQKATEELLRTFELKILFYVGLQPMLTSCVRCRKRLGSSGNFGFSITEGGAVCGDCKPQVADHYFLSAETLAFLQKTRDLSPRDAFQLKFPLKVLHESKKIIYPFLSYHLNREFHSIKVLNTIQTV
jgi:DNA repair protein RecO (recombination protein O)